MSEPIQEDWRKALSTAHLVAVGTSLAAFGIGLSSETRTEVNGVVTCEFVDYGAIILGGAAVLASVMALVYTVRRPSPAYRALLFGIAAVTQVLGLVHIARGLGVFHSC